MVVAFGGLSTDVQDLLLPCHPVGVLASTAQVRITFYRGHSMNKKANALPCHRCWHPFLMGRNLRPANFEILELLIACLRISCVHFASPGCQIQQR